MPVFMLGLLALVAFLTMFVLLGTAVLAESRQRRKIMEQSAVTFPNQQQETHVPLAAEEKPKARAAHA